ncbi:MAG: outer membrane protein transport protein [Chitinophagales bacterium]
MKRVLLYLLFFITMVANGQSYADEALMFAQTSVSGTARSIGSAGAYGSVGADLGCVTINPAGLGLYRSSDFSLTPAIMLDRRNSDFLSNKDQGGVNKFFINQAGFSFTKLFNKEKKATDFSFSSTRLNAITFALNYQRQNMFHQLIQWDGTNNFISAVSAYTDYLNATNKPLTPDNYPVEMVLAYDAGLITYDTILAQYVSRVNKPVRQSGDMILGGAADQIDAAIGGNVNDKFYFGAGVGFSILSYSFRNRFNEIDESNSTSNFQDYNVDAALRTSGFGLHAKFGIIYRPASWVRLGVSYQIPTFYNLTENYSVGLLANFDTTYYGQTLSSYPLKYKLRTPMKGTISTSFYLKEFGFLSVDYEFQNLGSSRFYFGKDYQSYTDAVNANEKKVYNFCHTIRAGIEAAYKTLRLRAGYAYSTTPYKKDYYNKQYPESIQQISAGLGYRGKRFYVDFTYLINLQKEIIYPYADAVVKTTNYRHNMFLTVGYRLVRDETPSKKQKNTKMSF